MDTPTRSAFTIGELADRFNVPTHRVKYAVLAHGIAPAARIRRWRLFDEDAAERIHAELTKGETRALHQTHEPARVGS